MNHKILFAMAASFLVLAGCGQQAEDTGQEEDYAEYERTGMELPASTTSDEAREQYMAGWGDLEVGRFNAANKHFASAGATDPAFAMAHMMTASTSASTEGFANNLTRAGENAAGATRGEQLLIESFQKGFAGDPAGQITAQQELTALHPDSARAWLFLGNSHGNLNNTADARAAYRKAIEMEHSLVAAHVELGELFGVGQQTLADRRPAAAERLRAKHLEAGSLE